MGRGKLALPAGPPRVRPQYLGHADLRGDWQEWMVPVLPARPCTGIRNGLPWVQWDWQAAHRASRRRAEEVLAAVTAVRARVAGGRVFTREGDVACAADGDWLSIDLAMDAMLEARGGAA